MIAMWLTACLISHPAQCRDFHPFRAPESLMACVVVSQRAAAQWASEHPQWRVAKAWCRIGKPGLHA